MYSKTVDKDQFYTSTKVSKTCVDILKSCIGEDYLFVEPSAGTGSFSDLVEDCIAYDIDPKRDYIIEKNFFDVELPKSNYVLFGNPPFGIRNKLSKEFIKRGVSDPNCKCIAFVLPTSYDKLTTQKVFPNSWKLIHSHDVGNDAFIVNGVPSHIPCKFYVWVSGDVDGDDLRTKERLVTIKDFSVVSRNEPHDLFIFGASVRKIIPSNLVTDKNRGYFLKSHIDKEILCDKIRRVDWESIGKSSVSGGVFWLTKNEFLCGYHDFYEEYVK